MESHSKQKSQHEYHQKTKKTVYSPNQFASIQHHLTAAQAHGEAMETKP
jgi:hypothetical protein